MSFWTRAKNVLRRDAIGREIDEELRLHMEEAIEAGRDPEEVRRAFGSLLRTREESRDVKISVWLEALRADTVFGARVLWKNKTASGAAILSLALTIGACTAAFRLVDAVLLRPMPVAAPERLYALEYEFLDQNGKKDRGDSFEYPMFRLLRQAAGTDAELMAISYAGRLDVTFGSDQEMEKARRQYVSGWTFQEFGLQPALGRLFREADDVKPGGHPLAVLSHDYWRRRFGSDPKVLGRTVRIGKDLLEIIGVAPEGFTGTETGSMTDIFVPTMMNAKAIENANWSWFRTWVRVKPGIEPEAVRQKLAAGFANQRREAVKKWKGMAQSQIDAYVNAPLGMVEAAAGVSGLQKDYRKSLFILAGLVALLLLIACANVANLMMAQSTARAKEMALRISIGAGRWRLVQMVLVESAVLALLATALGGLVAWWSAPFVVSLINPMDNPVRLNLPADGRVLGFAVLLSAVVVFLFGLVPALRASSVKPMLAIRGGDNPHGRRRLMNGLVAAQVAFCFLVHFVAGLFLASFDRLTHEPTGFSTERLLVAEVVAQSDRPYSAWQNLASQLQELRGVERVSLASWALLGGNTWSSGIRLSGQNWDVSPPYFLGVSPGWLETMRIPLLTGRDFRDADQHPAVAIVNEAFAKRYFDGKDPIGRSFETGDRAKPQRVEIVGWVRDAKYNNMREAVRPTVYVPLNKITEKGETEQTNWGTLVIRVANSEPLQMAAALRREVTRVAPEFRVSDVSTQQQWVDSHTVRERLLAMLSLFFAAVALLLAGVGLYGVLNYSVLQRRREIGIRMALGAMPGEVARRVMAEVLTMLVLGSAVGIATGIASERYLAELLYQVKTTEWTMLLIPVAAITGAAVLAGVAPVWQAVRTDPANVLRAE